jgi:hypothetical protein
VALVDTPLEVLAKDKPPPVTLSVDEQRRVACLALMLTQEAARRESLVLSSAQLLPWHERPEEAREAMRMGVVRVVQALSMLGYIEPP